MTVYNADALEMLWPDHVDYIFGNPPFISSRIKYRDITDEQFAKMHDQKLVRKINTGCDFICCFFKDAQRYLKMYKNTKCAFITTKSIARGVHVPYFMIPFLKTVYINYVIESIEFQKHTKMHAVGIVFSNYPSDTIYDPYLRIVHTPEISKSIERTKKHSPIKIGISLYDYGMYMFTEAYYEENKALFKDEHIKTIVNGMDIAKGTVHKILDLCNVPNDELTDDEKRRIRYVKEHRLENKSKPKCFRVTKNKIPKTDFVAFPRNVSGQHTQMPYRHYKKGTLVTVSALFIEEPFEHILKIIASPEFFKYLKDHAGKTGNTGIRFRKKYYYDYLNTLQDNLVTDKQ
jgi:hypothetical protein